MVDILISTELDAPYFYTIVQKLEKDWLSRLNKKQAISRNKYLDTSPGHFLESSLTGDSSIDSGVLFFTAEIFLTYINKFLD